MNLLGNKILKDVSRSFYLSMRVLPRGMREPISLGYLLARASDTLADTVGLDAELRSEMLAGFQRALLSHDRGLWLERLAEEVIPRQQHEGEIILLQNLGGVFSWLDSLKEDTLTDVRAEGDSRYGEELQARQHMAILRLMENILCGQRLDIKRFELAGDFRFTLDTELEEYCYLVAGCVGEFWTEIGFISTERFAKVDAGQMNLWGANYGKGLQLINILRDLPNDLQEGRCYLPGVDLENHEQLMSEAARWRLRARDYLTDGSTYAAELKHRRTRMATALPGIIGKKTLDLLDQADWSKLQRGVKISRNQVYRAVWQAFWR